ncbi:MAG: POTRA domain-containing protein, partial [Gammaproteobacteria bacterium]|nr:POTRA domain-containing protein [Gammaproteobacteria bacterium]
MPAVVCVENSQAAEVTGTEKTSSEVAKQNTGEDGSADAETKQEISFSIWEYQIAGNTLLQDVTLERALTPFLGPDKSATVINDAADALERLYRDKGYPTVFIDIPEQNVVAGVVRLQVNEAKVSRLRITGADYFTLSSLKEKVPSLRTGQAIHLPSVQEEIQKLHSYSPDLQAVPILKAGRDPGTMEIDLRVKDKLPLHGSLELNDHYSANTTKLRLEGSISYDNLWQKFHSLRVTAQTSPEDTSEVRVFIANYIMPVNDARDRLVFYAVRSDSNVAAVGGLAIIGQGNIYGTRYVLPFDSDRSWTHSATLGFDYKDVRDVVSVSEGVDLTTPIKYVVVSADYSATVFGDNSNTRYSAGVNFGIHGINDSNEFDDKRFNANSDFIYFHGGIIRTDLLPDDYSIVSNLKTQLAGSPLISNEQFTAGGYLSVRGYLESQILGDRGFSAGIELFSPKLFHHETDNHSIRLLAFFEGAAVETIDALPGQAGSDQLMSTGLGLRVTELKHLNIKLDWAYPLRDAGDA